LSTYIFSHANLRSSRFFEWLGIPPPEVVFLFSGSLSRYSWAKFSGGGENFVLLFGELTAGKAKRLKSKTTVGINGCFLSTNEITQCSQHNARLVLLLGRPSGLCERAPPTGRAKQKPPLHTPQSANNDDYD